MLINRNWTSDLTAEKVLTVKLANRRAFLDALDKIEKNKALVWDSDLLKCFSQLVTFTDLKNDHGVLEMFTLQKSPQIDQSAVDHVIYICRPELKKIDEIAKNMAQFSTTKKSIIGSKQTTLRLHAFFVPRSTSFCDAKLKEAHLLDRFESIIDLPIYMFSYNSDVLSLENSTAFRDLLLDGTSAEFLYDLAVVLNQMKSLFGPFHETYVKGDAAKHVYQLFSRLEQGASKFSTDQPLKIDSIIDRLIIFDRSVDLITPFVTQLTYEGLIDEYFGIQNGQCKFPAEKFSQQSEQQTGPSSVTSAGQPKGPTVDKAVLTELTLNSGDDMYAELRNLNFNAVGVNLGKKLKQLAEIRSQIQAATTVRECKEFVKRIPQLKLAETSASNHLTIAELIKAITITPNFVDSVTCEQEILNTVDSDRFLPFIDYLIQRGKDMNKVLRLICLQSLVSEGLRKKLLDQYRREFLQSFGYHNLNLLCKLQRAGLIKSYSTPSAKSSNFEQRKKNFHLIVDHVNEQTPDDISYVYSGLAPLLIRLCQYIQKSINIDTASEVLKQLPGATLTYGHPDYNIKREKTLCLVVFIGGVTFTEISALRFLSTLDENFAYVVLTTNMINGNSILKSMS